MAKQKKYEVELPWGKVELLPFTPETSFPKAGPTSAVWDTLDYYLDESEITEDETNSPDDLQYRMDCGWDNFTEDVAGMIKVVSDREIYRVNGRGMGWQNRSGMMYVSAANAVELFQKILPRTSDYTLNVQICLNPDTVKPMVAIRCSHHDAPTGEFYYINELDKKEWKQWNNDELYVK